jgi:arylsulfatase A-like enzyme
MIIFTSDHGDYMGHHHLLLKGGYLYDALAKIPLIIKYPEGKRGGKANAGSAHAGLVNTSLVNNVDLAPTILACAGMDKGKLMVGRNLAADSADAGAAGKRQDPERTMIFSESRNQCMARSERYKLLLCQNADQSQFFDLQKDPLEMNNVYADPANKEIIEDYIEKIVRWRLFDAPAPAYLNYAAPTASDSNIPKDPAAERDSSIAYFRNKGPWTTTSSGRS